MHKEKLLSMVSVRDLNDLVKKIHLKFKLLHYLRGEFLQARLTSHANKMVVRNATETLKAWNEKFGVIGGEEVDITWRCELDPVAEGTLKPFELVFTNLHDALLDNPSRSGRDPEELFGDDGALRHLLDQLEEAEEAKRASVDSSKRKEALPPEIDDVIDGQASTFNLGSDIKNTDPNDFTDCPLEALKLAGAPIPTEMSDANMKILQN